MNEPIRIDKFLWAVRVFKTRSESAEECKKGKVKINGIEAKPSREVRVGETIAIRKLAVVYSYKVLQLVSNRQPSKNVPLYVENITPQEELDKLNVKHETIFVSRERGAGRPTKKERRDIDKLMGIKGSEE